MDDPRLGETISFYARDSFMITRAKVLLSKNRLRGFVSAETLLHRHKDAPRPNMLASAIPKLERED
jgi:hypothetical protein